MTRGRKLGFAVVTVLAILLVVESAARVAESVFGLGPGARAAVSRGPGGDLRVAFYGGSTVIGVPLPEVGFVEQFRVLFEQRFPGRRLRVDNFGAAGIPSAGVVQRVADTLDADVDAWVLMTGHNEFIRAGMTEVDLERAYALGAVLDRLAAARLVRRALEAAARRHIDVWRVEATTTPELDVDRRVRAYAANVEAVLEIARSRGIPVLLCTAAANVADWPPARPGGAFRYPPALEAGVRRVRRSLDDGYPERALAEADGLLTASPGQPMLRFLRGQALRALGRLEEAQADLAFARDHDPVPRRAFSSMNDRVRALAERPGVVLVDVDRAFQDRQDAGASGFDLFADNCHPTPEGGYLIATTVLDAVERTGLAGAPAAAAPLPPDAVFEHLGFGPDSPLRLEYLARNARYCMKMPFYNFAAAGRYLDQALAVAPDRWDFWANRASMSLLSGDRERGLAELERAIALNPEPLDPDDLGLTPYLAVALKSEGVRLEGRTAVAPAPR